MLSEERLRQVAERIATVSGVSAVVLGGSRARGTERPDSDYDLGIYYRDDLDLPTLQALALELADAPVELAGRGGWGPWVDGGGWLRVDGAAMDWIYRDLDRVEEQWRRALRGEYAFHRQPGHPLGFLDVAYAGELALARVLVDNDGAATALARAAVRYPPALADAMVAGLRECDFILEAATKGAAGGDAVFVAGCLFVALGLAAHALHACAGAWAINEKGLIAAAGALPCAPRDFARRCAAVLARVDAAPDALMACLTDARAIVGEVRAAVA